MIVDQLTFHYNDEIFNNILNQLDTTIKLDTSWTTRQLTFIQFTNLSYKLANKTSKKNQQLITTKEKFRNNPIFNCYVNLQDCRMWISWIRPLLIVFYSIFLFVVTPLIVVNTVKDGFNRKDQLILIGSLFVSCALPITFFHFAQHLKHYTKPILQKHIIRILMMIPVFSLDALFGLIYPRYSLYIDGLREIYEAYVIYNFMKYLLNYLNLDCDFQICLQFKPQVNHFFPLCYMRPWKMGRELVHNCKHGILQYTLIRPLTTIISIICELCGVYGESEFKFSVAYPYITLINNFSQCVAMYCLVLFFKANRAELKPMKPIPKFLCIKAVVFFSFFQSVIINILVYFGVISNMFDSDIKEGDYKLLSSRLQNFLICIEMFFAALGHQYSFPYHPFQVNTPESDSNWFRSLLSMLDMDDVRQDFSEHFDVVGNRITRGFRTQPNYLQQDEEREFLVSSEDLMTVSRNKDRNYGTTEDNKVSDTIGKDKTFRIVEIQEKDKEKTSSPKHPASSSAGSSSSPYLGVNVRGLDENELINYKNPNV